LTKLQPLVVTGKIQQAYWEYQKIIKNFIENPGWYENTSPDHFYEMLSGFNLMYYFYCVSFVSSYLSTTDINNPSQNKYLGLSDEDIRRHKRSFLVQSDDLLKNRNQEFSKYGEYVNNIFNVVYKHCGEKCNKPSLSEHFFTEKEWPDFDWATMYTDFSNFLRKEFYRPENNTWYNAVKKYDSLKKEFTAFESQLQTFIESERMKSGGVINSENASEYLEKVEMLKSWINNYDNLIRYYLFDVPVLLFSYMTRQAIAGSSGIFWGYNAEKAEAVAVPFSALTTPLLPFTYENITREMWFETGKLIKKALNEKKYQEVQNFSSKVNVPMQVPKGFEVKWP